MPAHYLKHENSPKNPVDEDICLFAQTHYRNQLRRFGIKLDDRRRHMYLIGKTGMGKSTLMENMMLQDIQKGFGIGLVDPHGDLAEKMIDYIPANRINDVVYFNPSDTDYPIGFNILEVKNEEQKHLVAAGLMGVFKKIWPDVWSARMEYILNNTLLALLEYPGSTLLGINRLLSDKKYRNRVVRQVKDPVIKAFWQIEFASYSERYAQEAVASIQNKIGQFLSANVIRNMVAQVKSTVDVRKIMDEGKILIMNLSKGRIGEDNSRLLGGMLITKIQLAAMERVDTPEKDRRDFFLYVDEFQNFATPSFANILSEARKYRLSLIMAHQYVAQLDEVVGDAVFGNVGTICAFRVGGADSEILAKEFAPVFLEEDIVNLAKFNIMLKLMINGVASQPFSAFSLGPLGGATDSADKVIRVSRERYAKKREIIEEKITRWSGLGLGDDEDGDGEDEFDDDVNDAAPASEALDKQVALPAPKVAAPVAMSATVPVSLGQLPTRDHLVRAEPVRREPPKSAPVVRFDAPEERKISPPTQQPSQPMRTAVSAAPTQGGSFSPGQPMMGEPGSEKKKRKRKRKRKNKGGGGQDGGPGAMQNGGQGNFSANVSQAPQNFSPAPFPAPQNAPLTPPVAPNPPDVISFDDEPDPLEQF